MAKLPGSPGVGALKNLGYRNDEVTTLTKGTLIVRVYFSGGSYPSYWNTFRQFGPVATARFDHHRVNPNPPPEGMVQPDRGILYAAEEGPTCLVEVFQKTRIIHRTRNNPFLTIIKLSRDILLLDLLSSWPTRVGSSMAINSGPRPRARQWSRDIYEAFPLIEGLRYGSSMAENKPCFALFERTQKAIPKAYTFNRALSDPALTDEINDVARRYNYRVI